MRPPKSIIESMSTHVKRRLGDGEILDELNAILDYDFELSHFRDASDCVEEVCNLLNEKILDYIWEKTGLKVSLKEKDELYFYFVKKFGGYIVKKYKESKELNETKKTYMVTESQYKKLLEGSTVEDSIEDSKRFYKMFKRIIDEKFSELTYDESPRWSTHEDDVAWKDSDEDVFRYNDYAFLVKRGFFWSLMNYLPISHNATKMMFERYFKEKFPDKFFISVDEFDA